MWTLMSATAVALHGASGLLDQFESSSRRSQPNRVGMTQHGALLFEAHDKGFCGNACVRFRIFGFLPLYSPSRPTAEGRSDVWSHRDCRWNRSATSGALLDDGNCVIPYIATSARCEQQ